jgi:hypothetical protein
MAVAPSHQGSFCATFAERIANKVVGGCIQYTGRVQLVADRTPGVEGQHKRGFKFQRCGIFQE